jgi:Flp pilus assembly CpaE family ATPase
MLLTAMIFASNVDAQSRIQRRCVTLGDINLFRSPEYRPTGADMVRLINSFSPELALIEFYDREDAIKVEEVIHASCPNLAILGFADNWQHETLLQTNGGYLKVVSTGIGLEEFRQAIQDVMRAARTPRPENVIAFLPAKAGSGASTIALNVSGALANQCVKSTILIEADLHSGPAGMYLNLNPTQSVADALQESHRLDPIWNDLITPVGNFAILPACNIKHPVPQPSPWAYRRLMTYTRNRYEYVIFDLPEVVNQATEAIVTSAKTVYVVCTPEVPSLMLARKRCAGLRDRGVPEDRLQIVLNRYSKDGPEPAAIAEILGYPIGQVIPNDYKSLWEANLKRRLVDPKTSVGQAIEGFAWGLTGVTVAAPKPSRKMFGLFSAA